VPAHLWRSRCSDALQRGVDTDCCEASFGIANIVFLTSCSRFRNHIGIREFEVFTIVLLQATSDFTLATGTLKLSPLK
jgi:hypothetical protein